MIDFELHSHFEAFKDLVNEMWEYHMETSSVL